MERNFKVLTISYKNTPISVRGEVSLNQDESNQFITLLKETCEFSNLLVLSTCNRTEFYYSADENKTAHFLKCLGIVKCISGLDKYRSFFIAIDDHDTAVQHLFNVAMGLDAQVVGDIEISNQVKRAYQLSADENVAGPFLHRLLHTIFFTNKRVVQETAFRDGAASVSYAATELVTELSHNYKEPKILVLGLGEIGTALCKNLASLEIKNVTITNRTSSKVTDLAAETGFRIAPFSNVNDEIATADIIISSIAKSTPFVTLEHVKELEILSYKFFIDLSVPRSIDATIENVPGVLLYNIDSIQNKASEALEKRIKAIPQVEKIIQEAISDLQDWTKEMEVSPTIKKLKNALEDIRKEEVARFVKSASNAELEFLDKATKGMMQKVMKLPVLQLKAACKRGEADTSIDVLNDLFDLEKQPIDNQ